MAKRYIFSPSLKIEMLKASCRMERGNGASLLLYGPPGGGKTAFARAWAEHLGAEVFRFQCIEEKEREFEFRIGVRGVVVRDGSPVWVKGPCWKAFEASQHGRVVLLIDEVDKTPRMDPYLLQHLQDWEFEDPDGNSIRGNPENIAVVLTSNGRRQLPGEVLRRTVRVSCPFPTGQLLKDICREIGGPLSEGLLDLAIRIGDSVRKDDVELAPSPQELAYFCQDMMVLAELGELGIAHIREAAAGHLTKNLADRAAHLDRCWGSQKWAKALRTEAQRAAASGLTVTLREAAA